jgi:hypothetical protein
MVKSCSAYGCTNKHDKTSNISFHKFPLKRKEICQRWAIAMRRDKWHPKEHDCLCSVHFLLSDYLASDSDKPCLKEGAVPSVFNFPERLQKTTKPRKPPAKRKIKEIIENDKGEPKSFPLPSSKRKPTSSPKKQKLRRNVKTLKQKLRRRGKKVESMNEIIKNLKKKEYLSNEIAELLNTNFSGLTNEIMQSELANNNRASKGKRYSDEVKKFALTLNFYSPRAYNFLRTVFSLPAPSSISNWTSSVNCEPGIFKDVFEFLREKINTDNKYKECSLMFDGMYIKSGVIYNNSKGTYEGFTNFGEDIVGFNEDKIAKEALVFMLVGLQGYWKFPVGYVLCDGISGDGISGVNLNAITKNILQIAAESKINIRSVTCDGTSAT